MDRIALVIGNADYVYVNKLNNPTNDANDIASILEKLGFKVIKLLNGTLNEIQAAVNTFLSELDEYSSKYQHVAAHSYNEDGDPAYSQAAVNLSQAFCSGYYPELTFNLTKENTGTSLAVNTITGVIDRLHKESADVGIAAAAGLSGNVLGVNVQVKAAKSGLYRIAVWVLEDGIRGKQEGATDDWMNTHENAIRAMAGNTLNLRIYGEKMGELQPGQTVEKSFSVALDESWEAENCKVLVVVNEAGADGRYDLANCAVCPIGGVVAYDYK